MPASQLFCLHLSKKFYSSSSGFREAQAVLAGIVWRQEAQYLYRTDGLDAVLSQDVDFLAPFSYFCVNKGERIPQDSFYEVLKKMHMLRK